MNVGVFPTTADSILCFGYTNHRCDGVKLCFTALEAVKLASWTSVAAQDFRF